MTRFLVHSVTLVAIFCSFGLFSAGASDYVHPDPQVRALLRSLNEKYRKGDRYLPGYSLKDTQSAPGLPRVFAPTRPTNTYTKYPWHEKIVITIFWVGEPPKPGSPNNYASSWDVNWQKNFGGFDNPAKSARAWDFRAKDFIPQENPFYIALPYNDLKGWRKPKSTAKDIPWYKERYREYGRTIVKSQWLAIRYGSRTCYAQWEDVGPFETDDFAYVFGGARPKTIHNNGAGLDVSPAVRDFLQVRSGGRCDWRFVDLDEVPTGPWRKYGNNNPFVALRKEEEEKRRTAAAAKKEADYAYMIKLRKARDEFVNKQQQGVK